MTVLCLDQDIALQAFLKLPNVDAMSGDIMDDFRTRHAGTWQRSEDVYSELCLLDDREEEIRDYAAERRLYFDYLTPDYEALQEELEETFALTEIEGMTYVFFK